MADTFTTSESKTELETGLSEDEKESVSQTVEAEVLLQESVLHKAA